MKISAQVRIRLLTVHHRARLFAVTASFPSRVWLVIRQIADELNARGIKTVRGGLWYAATVRNVMARENEIEAQAA